MERQYLALIIGLIIGVPFLFLFLRRSDSLSKHLRSLNLVYDNDPAAAVAKKKTGMVNGLLFAAPGQFVIAFSKKDITTIPYEDVSFVEYQKEYTLKELTGVTWFIHSKSDPAIIRSYFLARVYNEKSTFKGLVQLETGIAVQAINAASDEYNSSVNPNRIPNMTGVSRSVSAAPLPSQHAEAALLILLQAMYVKNIDVRIAVPSPRPIA